MLKRIVRHVVGWGVRDERCKVEAWVKSPETTRVVSRNKEQVRFQMNRTLSYHHLFRAMYTTATILHRALPKEKAQMSSDLVV